MDIDIPSKYDLISELNPGDITSILRGDFVFFETQSEESKETCMCWCEGLLMLLSKEENLTVIHGFTNISKHTKFRMIFLTPDNRLLTLKLTTAQMKDY